MRPAGGVFLHLVAFDLARGADGAWRVIGTRTQAPSGVGYALENRAIISRLLPDAFRALRVHALSSVLPRAAGDAAGRRARRTASAPHVVVLTPGPYNETYFEHAYLARQLGFPLVEGGDLTVRDDRVFLKTVSGLRPRPRDPPPPRRRLLRSAGAALRFDARRAGPRAGVARGARARRQRVRHERPRVAGAARVPAAHLRAAARRNARRRRRSPPGGAARPPRSPTPAAALRRGDQAGVRRRVDGAGVPRRTSTPTARREWAERLGTDRDAYVVEEFLPLSHAPVWHDGRLESRALMLRVFLLADGHGDYRVMPGGLSRIAGEDRHVVSGQRGGSSKDTWVLSDAPVAPAAPVERRARLREAARRDQTSSRAAEHLFWLGRYAERSENGARLLRSVLGRLTDAGGVPAGLHPAFLRACARQGLLDEAVAPTSTASAIVHDLIAGLVDRQGAPQPRASTSSRRCASRARCATACRPTTGASSTACCSCSRATRAALDLDDALELDRRRAGVAGGGRRPRDGAHDPRRRLAVSEPRPSPRTAALRLERRSATSRRSDASAGSGLLEWLLELSDSLITYRVRHMQQPEWESVVDLMLVDERNPRSAAVPAGEAGQARAAAAGCGRADGGAGGGRAAAAGLPRRRRGRPGRAVRRRRAAARGAADGLPARLASVSAPRSRCATSATWTTCRGRRWACDGGACIASSTRRATSTRAACRRRSTWRT